MARRCNSSRLQRNVKEKNRRTHMKDLLGQLGSLIPPQTSKLSVHEILDQATSYIKQLQENEERLKRKKELLKGEETPLNNNTRNIIGNPKLRTIVNMRKSDSTLEVNLICGLDKNFMFYEIIGVLEEEGAEVIDATQLHSGDRIICIIKSKAIIPRIGIETSRVEEKLKQLVV